MKIRKIHVFIYVYNVWHHAGYDFSLHPGCYSARLGRDMDVDAPHFPLHLKDSTKK